MSLNSKYFLHAIVLLVAAVPAGHAQTPLYSLAGEAIAYEFGWSVDGGGDVDNDGVPDFVVGSPHYNGIASNTGKAYVYSGATGSLLHEFYGVAYSDHFGWTVRFAGDVDGDGHDDVAAAAPRNSTQAGRQLHRVRLHRGAYGRSRPLSHCLRAWHRLRGGVAGAFRYSPIARQDRFALANRREFRKSR